MDILQYLKYFDDKYSSDNWLFELAIEIHKSLIWYECIFDNILVFILFNDISHFSLFQVNWLIELNQYN